MRNRSSYLLGLLTLVACLLQQTGAAAGPAAHEVWVSDQALDKIFVFDGETLQLVAEIEVDGDGQPATSKPHFVSFSPDFKYAYVANVGTHNVTVIDAVERKRIAQVPAGRGAHAAIASPDGRRVWVANPGDHTVTEFTVHRNRFSLGRTLITGDQRPMVIAFSRDGRRAYVTNSGDANAADPTQTGSITVFDVASGTSLKMLSNTGKNTLVPVTSSYSTELYVSVGDPMNQLLTVDTERSELAREALDIAARDPHGVALTPDNKLVVVSRQEAKLLVLDAPTLLLLKEITVGEKPDMIALSPDGRTAYVTLRGQAVTGDPFALSGPTPGLAVIDLVRAEQSQLIAMSGDPHGVAVRPLAMIISGPGSGALWIALALIAVVAWVLLRR